MGNYEMDCRVQFFEHELAYCYEKEGILQNYGAEDLIEFTSRRHEHENYSGGTSWLVMKNNK